MRAASPLAEQFGANLRRSRRRAGLTQQGLAQLTGLHRGDVGALERGLRLPRLDTILKLSAGADASVCVLTAGLHWRSGRYVEGDFYIEDAWRAKAGVASFGRPA